MMFLVMNMKYIIYEYATGMEKLFEQYPHLKDYFDSLTLDNNYLIQLMECAYTVSYTHLTLPTNSRV